MIRKHSSKNKVGRQKKLIVVTANGDQTTETILETKEAITEILRKPFGSKDILIDLRKVGIFDDSALQEACNVIKSMRYRRIALFGANAPIMRLIMRAVVGTSVSDNTKVKIFRQEQAARNWLDKMTPPKLLK